MTPLRIYTFIPRIHGPIRLWKDSLLHIRKLGFNAIHLLPLTKFGPSQSPYAAYDLFCIDEGYSETKNSSDGFRQLNQFAKECRQMKVALIIDLVFNNIGLESRMVKEHPAWIVKDETETDGIKRAGFSDGEKWHKWEDTALIQYNPRDPAEKEKLWQAMGEYALLWGKFAVNTGGGIRLDNLHSSDETFILWVLEKIRSQFPRVFVTGEYFGLEENIFNAVKTFKLDFILATPWEHKFAPLLRTYLQYLHRLKDRVRYFFPVNSHDSGAVSEEFGSLRSSVPRLAVSALMGPGPWGITEGVEAGVETKIPFMGPIEKRPANRDPRLCQMISELNSFREKNDQFQICGNFKFCDNDHPAILAGVRNPLEASAKTYCVAANMDIHNSQTCIIRNHSNIPKVEGWEIVHSWTYEEKDCVGFSFSGESLVLDMPPASAIILKGI